MCGGSFIVMATFTGTIYSQVMGMRTGLTVVTPALINYTDETPYKVVYLLHGLSDDHTCWLNNTQLTLISDEYNIAFICPEVQRSFYADTAHGLPYFTYITEELPKICKKLFCISHKRENTYVMGLSMGGYGALKCALSRPEQYLGCGAFSSACDLETLVKDNTLMSIAERQGITGMELKLSPENDLFRLADKCQSNPMKPQLFMACGTEDWLLPQNQKFRDFVKPLGFDLTYQEWEGNHNWYFWDEALRRALTHFLQK